MKQGFLKFVAMTAIIMLTTTANATPTTVLKFLKGSTCTSYVGELGKGRLFKLGLKKGQEFTIGTLDDGYAIKSATDNTGKKMHLLGTEDETAYLVEKTGIHQILMTSQGKVAILFCAE